MVETALTPELIEEGEKLVRALDEAGYAPDAAFWFYSPETKAWKLVLAEMKVGPEGPREVYRAVQRAIPTLAPRGSRLSLEDVAVAKPDSRLVALLRKALGTGRGIGGIRFKSNVIDGTLVEDAYIYRLVKPSN